MPDEGYDQHIELHSPAASRQILPVLVQSNVSLAAQKGRGWWPVMCPTGRVTHAFLACDVTSFCWAGGHVTISLRAESWALPTSESCPVPLAMPALPPSFPCRSQEQCVSYSLVCDHRRDCLDGSDETFCTFLPCQWQSQFQCLNRQVCLVLLIKMFYLRNKAVNIVFSFCTF